MHVSLELKTNQEQNIITFIAYMIKLKCGKGV
jgi:hypothetical protein